MISEYSQAAGVVVELVEDSTYQKKIYISNMGSPYSQNVSPYL
jgi:hypothetical protein